MQIIEELGVTTLRLNKNNKSCSDFWFRVRGAWSSPPFVSFVFAPEYTSRLVFIYVAVDECNSDVPENMAHDYCAHITRGRALLYHHPSKIALSHFRMLRPLQYE
jgi:hypothetical protein